MLVDIIKRFSTAFLLFIIFDFIWIMLFALSSYKLAFGNILRSPIQLLPALIFYFIFLSGLFIFVINPGIETKNFVSVILKGALFGLVAYSTYALTCLSIFRPFTLKLALIDMFWGPIVSACISGIIYILFART